MHQTFSYALFVYRPGEDKMPTWSKNFESEMDDAYIESKDFVMGDFNVDLLMTHKVHPNWLDITEGFSLTQLITEPTRLTETHELLLDHIYVTSPNQE